jgi:hypothetical protein
MVVGPKVNKLVEEFSSVCGISPIKKSKHHEEAHTTQKDSGNPCRNRKSIRRRIL